MCAVDTDKTRFTTRVAPFHPSKQKLKRDATPSKLKISPSRIYETARRGVKRYTTWSTRSWRINRIRGRPRGILRISLCRRASTMTKIMMMRLWFLFMGVAAPTFLVVCSTQLRRYSTRMKACTGASRAKQVTRVTRTSWQQHCGLSAPSPLESQSWRTR